MTESGSVDLVTFEVLRHRLWEINDEMGLLAGRISGSPAVYESGDFNSAILTPEGDGLFAGVYVIRQASALDIVVRSVLERFDDDINPGDVFLTNDPWAGALHAMDAAVVAPVFWEDEVVAWTGIVMHELDVGGPRPGSWSVGATNAYQECPLLPPVKLVSDGRLRADVEAAFLRNSRTPQINALNLRAKVASQVTTRERLHDVIRKYGKDTFLSVQARILDYVSGTVRERIGCLPDGEWRSSCILDHDGNTDRLYQLKLRMQKSEGRLIFDFRGTDTQAPGPINCAYSGLVGGILQVLFPLLCFDVPWSHGAVSRCIEIVSEESTLNNATYPAATSMATVNACQATGDLVWEAMAKAYGSSTDLRDEIIALGYGGVNMSVMAGTRRDGSAFVNLFTDSVGGGGARSFKDGVDTSGNFIAPAYAIPNVERIESLIPVLYLYRRQRAETAGAGMYRGGVGLEFMVRPHRAEEPWEAVYFSSGCSHPGTKGVFGGLPGVVQRNVVLRDTRVDEQLSQGIIPTRLEEVSYTSLEVMEAKDTGELRGRDVWLNYCTGGGGYADPLLRSPAAVELDVRHRTCTSDEAKKLYGVVLSFAGAVDEYKTEKERTRIRKSRLRRAQPPLLHHTGREPRELGAGLLRIGESIELYNSVDGHVFACRECQWVIAGPNDNLREGAALVEYSIDELMPLNGYGRTDEVVVRLYCCPGCGIAFLSDVQLVADDPYLSDFVIDVRLAAEGASR